ncbi:hypothetical protein OG897_28025 [Streptomyces sp. NBC_00237]|uniref:hypothetical protein n=1 Tax=Streptomyces sp. NBC_00237 TaxID=2975687 RepID=UPI00224D2C6B|nr:hypothetical protein [Streptomyces sp. NBC_00237]MCX5205293.1 hypothetical protein [Streptomyces sp. NBC_00237]
MLAYAISAGLVLSVGGLDRGAPLLIWLNPLGKVLVYSLIWPVAATAWPPKAPTGAPTPQK